MKKFLIAIALALASVACNSGGASLTGPTGPELSTLDASGSAAMTPVLVGKRTKSPRVIVRPLPVGASVNWLRADAIAAEANCRVYALGGPRGIAIFVSCEGSPVRQVAQNEICLPYSDNTFAGTCVESATCVSTHQIGAYGPIYTGTCNVP